MEPRELFSKALAFHETARTTEAIDLYRRLLCLQPAHPGVMGLMGTALTQEGAHQDAISALKRALFINPTHAATYSNLGIAIKDSGEPTKALRLQRMGLALDPALFEALRNLALTLRLLKRPHEALSFSEIAVHLAPGSPEALSLQGNLLFDLDHKDRALHVLRAAITLHPADPETYANLGAALLKTRKIDAALITTERSRLLQAKNPECWVNLGLIHHQAERTERALQSFDAAIALDPGLAPGYSGRAICLKSCGKFFEAADFLMRARKIDQNLSASVGLALYCWSKTLAWQPINELLRWVRKELANGNAIDNPFPLLTRVDDPRIHLLSARTYSRKAYPEREQNQPAFTARSRKKIRLAYFTSDLQPLHPVYKNLLPLLKAHDRSQFELYCFYSDNPETLATPELFDHVIPIQLVSGEEVARKAQEFGIDIAIDLNGYTEGERTDVFAARVAPLQINYLGYPGTMGSTYHDFIIADAHVIPEGSETFYSERVLRLPSFFMPYDLRANQATNVKKVHKARYGLPEDAFIYCSFNDFHKITEETFNAWLEILQGSDQSILWLATRGGLGIEALKNMFDEAGIDPRRLIEAHRVESAEEHHARLALADLMLDTFPYNSHTTACDAISVGLPLLTRSGRSFASRVSASLLATSGLDSLITENLSEYVETAIALSKDSKRYTALRQKVLEAPNQIPSIKAYTRAFESLMAGLVDDQRSKARTGSN
jgi:protein O-GlcNAc transferase